MTRSHERVSKILRRASATGDGEGVAQPGAQLTSRVDALTEAAERSRGRLPDEDVNGASIVADKVRERMRHGTTHTVVAIAGATGAGKSSIVNRLAGQTLSDPGVLRPTTSVTHAVVWGEDDAGPLLDWLEVNRRYRITDGSPSLSGLVLLDLPDHDSTAVEHRLEVDRLVALVDALVWVTDPQKYADDALHAGYIRPLASHQAVLWFVLNQVDRLRDGGVSVARDLVRLLEDDGIDTPRVVSISATTGVGFEGEGGLTDLIEIAVNERRASVERLEADLVDAASLLRRGGPIAEGKDTKKAIGFSSQATLIAGLSDAAGAEQTGEVARAHHYRQGMLKMGWPFTRWARRLGRRPLAELPGPGRTGAAEPRADLALRDYAEAVSERLAAPWPTEVRIAAMSERDELLDDLRRTVGRAAVGSTKRPLWWNVVSWIQSLFAVTAVVGLGWLLTVAVLSGFFRFDSEPLLPSTPQADWIPIPSAMMLGGVILGLAVGFLIRFPLGLAASRRGRAARREVADQVSSLAEIRVVKPVEQTLIDHREIDRLLDIASGRLGS